MDRYEKAVANLLNRGISAYRNQEYVYVDFDGIELEISSAEIEFQSELYDTNE
jgi:hypothetical protein